MLKERQSTKSPIFGKTIQKGIPFGSDGKESPTMQETRVRSLGQEDPLEKRMATYSSILAWRIPWTVHGVAESDTTEQLSLFSL